MSAEARPQVKQYTPEQMGFQRLLIKDSGIPAQPGDGLKKFGLNLSVFAASTAIDVAEGKLAESLISRLFDDAPVASADQGNVKVEKKEVVKKVGSKSAPVNTEPEKVSRLKAWGEKIKEKRGPIKFGVEFVEEWVSDDLMKEGANAMVRGLTGMREAEYVSEASAVIADWTSMVVQVFTPDSGIKGVKIKNMVSPVNVEAAFRTLAEVPLAGPVVSLAHEQLDKLFAAKAVQKVSTGAAKFLLGYHILNTQSKAVGEAVSAANK